MYKRIMRDARRLIANRKPDDDFNPEEWVVNGDVAYRRSFIRGSKGEHLDAGYTELAINGGNAVRVRVLEPAVDEYFVPPEDWNISESAKQILGVWPYTKKSGETE